MSLPVRVWMDRARRYLWRRFSVPLPARPGWVQLLRKALDEGGAYVDHVNKVQGAPVEWTLLAKVDGRWQGQSMACPWSGRPMSGVEVIRQRADGSYEVDGDQLGVRCARCGTPIHHRFSGRRSADDVPSCPPCRPLVRLQGAIARSFS